MKRIFLVLAMLTATLAVFAQQTIRIDANNNNDSSEVKTLFKSDIRDGFYVGASMAYSPINKSDGIITSARLAWIMDRWFAFGFSGSAFLGSIDKMSSSSISDGDFSFLTGAYGGIFIEPILMPLKTVHVSFPVVVGGGALANSSYYYYSDDVFGDDVFFVFEPGVEFEINFTQWLRFAVFGTYRYTSDVEMNDVASNALRSYSLGASLKVGLF